jgi:hypothetical protein
VRAVEDGNPLGLGEIVVDETAVEKRGRLADERPLLALEDLALNAKVVG